MIWHVFVSSKPFYSDPLRGPSLHWKISSSDAYSDREALRERVEFLRLHWPSVSVISEDSLANEIELGWIDERPRSYFDLNETSGRMARHWKRGSTGISWRTMAKKYAITHGRAVAWRGDGSAVLFYRDGEKVRQKTFPCATPVSNLPTREGVEVLNP